MLQGFEKVQATHLLESGGFGEFLGDFFWKIGDEMFGNTWIFQEKKLHEIGTMVKWIFWKYMMIHRQKCTTVPELLDYLKIYLGRGISMAMSDFWSIDFGDVGC